MLRGIGRLRVVLGVLGAIVLLGGAAVGLGLVGTPGVTDVRNSFGPVDEETTTVVTEVTVSNPNPIGLRLGGLTVNYTVDLNDVRLAGGTKEGVNVTTGNSTLTFRTAMDNEQIPAWWVAHIRDGETSDLVVHAEARSSTLGRTIPFQPVDREVPTDLLSAFNSSETRPVNADRAVVSDPVLYVNRTSAHWGSVTDAETPIEMAFDVYNPKSVPYAVTGIGYEITMNEVAVGAGESERAYSIPPKSTRTVRASTAIENGNLDEWWVTHVERNQVTDLRIDFYARIELPSGNEIRVPLDALTYTETIETDIFGTKEASGGGEGTGSAGDSGEEGGSDGSTPTEDGDATTTSDGGSGGETTTEGGLLEPTETTTSTETATATATSTATETDDGLL